MELGDSIGGTVIVGRVATRKRSWALITFVYLTFAETLSLMPVPDLSLCLVKPEGQQQATNHDDEKYCLDYLRFLTNGLTLSILVARSRCSDDRGKALFLRKGGDEKFINLKTECVFEVDLPFEHSFCNVILPLWGNARANMLLGAVDP